MGGGSADLIEEQEGSRRTSASTNETQSAATASRGRKNMSQIPGLQEDPEDVAANIAASESDHKGSIACSSGSVCKGTISNGSEALPNPALPWHRDDYVRIIMQALNDLGYTSTVTQLESEANLHLHEEPAVRLQSAVLDGKWAVADTLLTEIQFEEEAYLKWKIAIRRQKFLELLDSNESDKALEYLRSEIAPLKPDKAVLQDLTCLLLISSPKELRQRAGWTGPNLSTRQQLWTELKDALPPRLVIPPRRLEHLLAQSLLHQEEHCVHYNLPQPWNDLLQDCHASADENLPQVTLHLLEDHQDEVWYIQFSHDGRRLASASKDKTVIIWDVSLESASARLVLRGHTNSVAFLAWSPDDKQLLSCGNDHGVRLWDAVTGECLREFVRHTDSVTAAIWLPDGEHFVSGGLDKQLLLWRVNADEPVGRWVGERVNDLALCRHMLITAAPDKKMRVYTMPERAEVGVMAENDSCTSLCLSSDGRLLLVNISSESRAAVHLWDTKERVLLQRFQGHRQARYVIRSGFGGVRDAYVVSGSEDSLVYIWHRHTGALLHRLPGHAGTINSVAWNPKETCMLASASDDNTIRIWAPPRYAAAAAAARDATSAAGGAASAAGGAASAGGGGGSGGAVANGNCGGGGAGHVTHPI